MSVAAPRILRPRALRLAALLPLVLAALLIGPAAGALPSSSGTAAAKHGKGGPPGFAVTIEGTANPWLAGRSGGGPQDGTPPTLVPVKGKHSVRLLEVTGEVSCRAVLVCRFGPDGGRSLVGDGTATYLAQNGIAGLVDNSVSGPTSYYLVGVFLTDAEPIPGAEPPPSDVTNAHNVKKLKPGIAQPFFIGDGLTSRGKVQKIAVPHGATRLFLGIADQCASPAVATCYHDNTGSLTAEVVLNRAGLRHGHCKHVKPCREHNASDSRDRRLGRNGP